MYEPIFMITVLIQWSWATVCYGLFVLTLVHLKFWTLLKDTVCTGNCWREVTDTGLAQCIHWRIDCNPQRGIVFRWRHFSLSGLMKNFKWLSTLARLLFKSQGQAEESKYALSITLLSNVQLWFLKFSRIPTACLWTWAGSASIYIRLVPLALLPVITPLTFHFMVKLLNYRVFVVLL